MGVGPNVGLIGAITRRSARSPMMGLLRLYQARAGRWICFHGKGDG